MFCPKCGKVAEVNQKFCAGCGADLTSDGNMLTQPAVPHTNNTAAVRPAAPVKPVPAVPQKNNSGLLFRIAGLLAAAAIAVSAFLPFWSYSAEGRSGSLSLAEYGLPGVIVCLIAAAGVLFSAAGVHAGNIGCGIAAAGYAILRDINLESMIERDYGSDAASMLELLDSGAGFYLLLSAGAVLLLLGIIRLAVSRKQN